MIEFYLGFFLFQLTLFGAVLFLQRVSICNGWNRVEGKIITVPFDT